MSDANKAILTRANAEVLKGNNERFLACCTDGVVWEFVGEQTLKGKEAVQRYMSETYVEPPKVTIDRLIAEGEFVTAIGEISLRGKDGQSVNYAYCDVWRLRDGKLAELKAFVVEAKRKG